MNATRFPLPRTLLLESSLYQKHSVTERDGFWMIIDFLHFAETYDSYCTKCARDSTFRVIPPARPQQFVRNMQVEEAMKKIGGGAPITYPPSGIHILRATCTRTGGHEQSFVFLIEQVSTPRQDGQLPTISATIEKIGQFPSFADVHLASIKKYSSVLTPKQLGELSRAIGLASHDVGIGAYVYLRRTFEALVEEAHAGARGDSAWDESKYERGRMSERIAMLKSHLPPFLGDNPHMYSLLSKGVHELSEEECLSHFETLRVSTELILDEKIQAKDRAKKIASAKAALAKATGNT